MKKKQSIPDRIWLFFSSVKLAVYTLVLLAVSSIIGTIILQNGDEQQYLREYGQALYNLIKVFNFDDMYHAWWFFGLIIILCINIVVCSIERLGTTWKIIFPKTITFNKARFRKLKNLESFSMNSEAASLSGKYQDLLARKIGKPIQEQTEDSIVLYAEKGRWTRIGVYLVHSSILLLLIGALIGAMFGFKADLKLDEGKTSDTVVTRKGSPIKLGFSIRCNDFEVKFYDTGAPEEFRSNLTILENGKESFTKDIRVNHPLRYKGINIFQASYGQAAPDSAVFDIVRLSDNNTVATHRLKIGEIILLPDDQGRFRLEGFIPHYDFRGQDLGAAFIGTILPKDGKPFQIGLPLKFSKFDRMRKGKFAFTIKESVKSYFTGLQVTKDPGIWYVYSGFILMIIGCWVTFFMSHQSYMIEILSSGDRESMVCVSGTTNRNNQGMKLKIKKLIQQLKN